MLEELALEVVYLEAERDEYEENEQEMEVIRFYARAKEARHIMVKLFGSETTVTAIIDAREKCKDMSAYAIWQEYIWKE